MSELLRLQDWLGKDDAIRFAGYLGLSASEKDFFIAYTTLKYPLKLDFKNPKLYLLDIKGEEKSYPVALRNYTHQSSLEWHGEGGILYRQVHPAVLAGSFSQNGYGLSEAVWVKADFEDVPFDDFSTTPTMQTVPAYWHVEDWDGFSDPPDFQMVFWSDLLEGANSNALLFSKEHVEKLVNRVLSKSNPATDSVRLKDQCSNPSFYDGNHESYPPELHAAVLLWEALYVHGEKSQHHPHQTAAKLWLEKNKEKIPTSALANSGSNAMIDRLVTITTPSAKKPKK